MIETRERDQFLSWAAGYIEARGRIAISRLHRRWYSLYVSVQNHRGRAHLLRLLAAGLNTPSPLDYAARVNVEIVTRTRHRTIGTVQVCRLHIAHRAAGRVCAMLAPHFRSAAMRERALLGAGFAAQKRRGRQRDKAVRDAYMAKQQEFWARMRAIDTEEAR